MSQCHGAHLPVNSYTSHAYLVSRGKKQEEGRERGRALPGHGLGLHNRIVPESLARGVR